MEPDRAAAEAAIAEFLRALGHPTDSDPELVATPARVAEAFADDLLGGYSIDVEALLDEGSEPAVADAPLVLIRPIAVSTVCPHHLMPGVGTAAVAYLPGRRIVGLGTLARLVEAHARRLTLQETIVQNVVGSLMSTAGARGAFCELTMLHTCLAARGARQTEATVRTVASAGDLSTESGARQLRAALREDAPESGAP